jgi:hypothetical protein
MHKQLPVIRVYAANEKNCRIVVDALEKAGLFPDMLRTGGGERTKGSKWKIILVSDEFSVVLGVAKRMADLVQSVEVWDPIKDFGSDFRALEAT